jgi:hypothetical protein
MSATYELNSPFINLEFNSSFKTFVVAAVAWMVLWFAVCAGLIYAFAVVVPQMFGFQTTLLGGLAFLILTEMAQ